MSKLSRRQRHILDFITNFIKEHHYAPSIRQIGAGVGLSSLSTVHSHLRSLQTKGYLSRVHCKPRSISLLVPGVGDA